MSVNQYHRLTNALHQWKNAIDDLIQMQNIEGGEDIINQQWHKVKDWVRTERLSM